MCEYQCIAGDLVRRMQKSSDRWLSGLKILELSDLRQGEVRPVLGTFCFNLSDQVH